MAIDNAITAYRARTRFPPPNDFSNFITYIITKKGELQTFEFFVNNNPVLKLDSSRKFLGKIKQSFKTLPF